MSTPAPTPPRSGRLPLLAVLLVAVAAGVGLWAGERWFNAVSAQPALATAVMYGAPRALPPFQLQGPAAAPVTNAALQGRWHLAFIGFLHCPDVCPTTLATLGQAVKQLDDLPEAQRPRMFFLSVDPGRDTPDAVGSYAHHFSPSALAATGEKAQIDALVQSLGMLYMLTPLDGDDYTVDHSPTIALINPQGQMAGVIRPPLDPAKIAADLRALATR
jgi:protein SCO1/2